MAEEAKKTIHLQIPFKSKEQSILVSEVLGVDKELKGSDINKTINVNDDGLFVIFEGSDYKKIRVTVNAFLKNVLLVVKTVQLFE